MRSRTLFACLLLGAACLHAQQSTMPTTIAPPTPTIQPASTSLVPPQNAGQGASSGIDAMVSAEVSAAVKATVPAELNLRINALSSAAGSSAQGKSLDAGAAGMASQLSAAISSRGSLASNKGSLVRQAMQKIATQGDTKGLSARSSKVKDYNSASAILTISAADSSSSAEGSAAGAGGSASAEGQFPDSTQGTGWPSPPQGSTLLKFSVGVFDAQEPGGFMDETHLKPSLMNVTRGEVRAEKRAALRRRMQERQSAEGSEATLPGLHSLGTQNLTPSLEARPQFPDTHYPTSDLQTGYPK